MKPEDIGKSGVEFHGQGLAPGADWAAKEAIATHSATAPLPARAGEAAEVASGVRPDPVTSPSEPPAELPGDEVPDPVPIDGDEGLAEDAREPVSDAPAKPKPAKAHGAHGGAKKK